MNQYFIVLHGTPSEWNKLSKDRQNELINSYKIWVERLRTDGRFKAGSELHPMHRDIRKVEGKITVEGPFPESKEVLTGYFIVAADSLEEAVRLGRDCPALSHGDWVQVYEMPIR